MTEVSDNAFANSEIESVTFSENMERIGAKAFYKSELKTINFSDTVKFIGKNAFMDCEIEEVLLPKSLVEVGEYAFSGNEKIKSVVLPASVGSFYGSAFSDCKELESFSVEKGNKVYKAVKNCILRKDELVAAANNVVSVPDGVKTIGAGVFSQRDIESIELPAWVETIDNSAFASCTKLKEIKFNSGLKTLTKSAFDNCDSLTSSELPDTVETVESYAFAECDRLLNVTLGEGIREISGYAFNNSDKVKYNLITEETLYSEKTEYYLPTKKNPYFALMAEENYTDGIEAHVNCAVIASGFFQDLILSVNIKEVCSDSVSEIYYKGTPDQWKEVEFDGDAQIYYHSYVKPSADEEYFYWYYGSGNKPVIWE